MASDDEGLRKPIVWAAGVLALIGLSCWIWSRLPPPQLAADEQVFTTVDALFTALTARDRARLEECERRLQAYRKEGKLSEAPAARLDTIIRQARDGKWEPAAQELYGFIRGQRGERAAPG